MPTMQSGTPQSQGPLGWTGGEDGRLCCWKGDDSPGINRSWISSTSTLAMKLHEIEKTARRRGIEWLYPRHILSRNTTLLVMLLRVLEYF
ncbi:hypothetical protein ES319_A12G139300v1 [Gossypium barbadense]|uniref:Uncharacterized protein n=2 Tax=Gossypium TaxID=3633 RepID=A0A5J5TDW2_GOSBA|nr:hypothetical protein ES319_A12G139300v1 [Gossypium barbadense]TYG90038.1 hypothetical protein ES288_A12G151500v1 [Gossypium darwinii]